LKNLEDTALRLLKMLRKGLKEVLGGEGDEGYKHKVR
jgi:hypothetical protein